MFVLTGIHGEGKLARIWDSTDGVSDDVDFITIANRITSKEIKVYGLRIFKSEDYYPPDAVTVPHLGIVVVPSEASTALRRLKKTSDEDENEEE